MLDKKGFHCSTTLCKAAGYRADRVTKIQVRIFTKRHWNEINHLRTDSFILTVSMLSACVHSECVCFGEPKPGVLSSFWDRKSSETLFMFKVISTAAAAHHLWLCNLVSSLRFALIWQMLKQTLCFAPLWSICVWSGRYGTQKHCIQRALLSQWHWEVILDISEFQQPFFCILHLYVPVSI